MPKPISNKENADQTTGRYYFTSTGGEKIINLTTTSGDVILVIRTIKHCWWEGNLAYLLLQRVWLYKAKAENTHTLGLSL